MKVGMMIGTVLGLMLVWSGASAAADATLRSDEHEEYAKKLWTFIQGEKYQQWPLLAAAADFKAGPPANSSSKHFGRRAKDAAAAREGAMIVTEHYAGEPATLTALTVRLKRQPGFNARHDDWYWVHFSPDGQTIETAGDKNPWAKRGFAVFQEDGRLWVFDADCPELPKYLKDGELAKHVVLPGAGPARMTLRGPDAETLERYIATKPGFVTFVDDGRAWVFRKGTAELEQFNKQGELVKFVVRPSAGPRGMTLRAPDAETLDDYQYSKPGFTIRVVDERLWVFKDGAEELAQFNKDGELAKHVVRPAAGPGGVTLKAPDIETLDEYVAAQAGFVTQVVDGRVWVFREGCPELKDFLEKGELAKHVVRLSAGPGGMTVRAPDAETLDAYLRACGL